MKARCKQMRDCLEVAVSSTATRWESSLRSGACSSPIWVPRLCDRVFGGRFSSSGDVRGCTHRSRMSSTVDRPTSIGTPPSSPYCRAPVPQRSGGTLPRSTTTIASFYRFVRHTASLYRNSLNSSAKSRRKHPPALLVKVHTLRSRSNMAGNRTARLQTRSPIDKTQRLLSRDEQQTATGFTTVFTRKPWGSFGDPSVPHRTSPNEGGRNTGRLS